MKARDRRAVTRDNDLTADEQTHVRAALRFLRTRCGGWAPLAKVLQFNPTHLCEVAGGRAAVSASMAVRIARLAKVEIEAVLMGCYPAPDLCPCCGQRKPDDAQPASIAPNDDAVN